MSKLIIFRGNSGSGKSTVALEIGRTAKNNLAIIDADNYREAMLFPKPVIKADLAALMSHNVVYCLSNGYDVVWDSIFFANDRNKEFFAKFFKDQHPDDNFIFNFDISIDETVRRHATRPKNNSFTAEEMKKWYQPVQGLGHDFEYTIPDEYAIEQTIEYIKQVAGI